MSSGSGKVFSSARRFGRTHAVESESEFWETAVDNPNSRLLLEQKEIIKTHFLEEPLRECLDTLNEDLKIIDYSRQFAGETGDPEKLFAPKIRQRLTEYMYDTSPEDINEMVKLIVLKPWPKDWNTPEGTLYVSGIESQFLLLLRVKDERKPSSQLTPEKKISRSERLQKIEDNKLAKWNAHNLSRYHSKRI